MEHQESICPHCTDGHIYCVLNLQLKHLKSEVCLVWPLYSYQVWRYNHTAIYAQEGFQLCGTNWISSASQKISFLTCSVYDNWLIIGCIATQSNISSPNSGAQIEMSGGKKSYLPNYCLIINFHDAVWITASSSASEMNNNVIAYWQKLNSY